MPHLDFREALSTPDEKLFSQAAAIPVAIAVAPAQSQAVPLFAGFQLSRSALTNIVFVAIAAMGGLLCGFYFFNGNEVLRAAASWPNEFLYPRPLSTDKIDIGVQPNSVDYFNAASSEASGARNRSSTSSGAPAAPTNLNTLGPTANTTASAPAGTTPFIPPSLFAPVTPLFDQVTQLVPDSGVLFQTLSQTGTGITTTAATTTQSTTTKLSSTRKKLTITRPKISTQTNLARSSTTRTTTQTTQQTSAPTQMGMNSFQTPNQSMIGTGVGGMGSVGGLGSGLGGVGGLGNVGGGVGGVGVLPGHH